MTPFDFEEIIEPLDGGEEDDILDEIREMRQEQLLLFMEQRLDYELGFRCDAPVYCNNSIQHLNEDSL